MKKFILLFSLLIFGTSVMAEDSVFSPVYANKLFHCLPDTHSFKLGNEEYSTHTSGWRDSKCKFTMAVTDKKNNITNYSCRFSRAQVNALHSAIKSDPEGNAGAKNLFKKYRKDNTTCEITD